MYNNSCNVCYQFINYYIFFYKNINNDIFELKYSFCVYILFCYNIDI